MGGQPGGVLWGSRKATGCSTLGSPGNVACGPQGPSVQPPWGYTGANDCSALMWQQDLGDRAMPLLCDTVSQVGGLLP